MLLIRAGSARSRRRPVSPANGLHRHGSLSLSLNTARLHTGMSGASADCYDAKWHMHCTPQQTRGIHPMLGWCWLSVGDAGQHHPSIGSTYHTFTRYILPCKDKKQHLLICEVSRYCILALHGYNTVNSTHSAHLVFFDICDKKYFQRLRSILTQLNLYQSCSR